MENARRKLEVADCLTGSQLKLMTIEEPGEFSTAFLPLA
jgi:hypothetical protein